MALAKTAKLPPQRCSWPGMGAIGVSCQRTAPASRHLRTAVTMSCPPLYKSASTATSSPGVRLMGSRPPSIRGDKASMTTEGGDGIINARDVAPPGARRASPVRAGVTRWTCGASRSRRRSWPAGASSLLTLLAGRAAGYGFWAENWLKPLTAPSWKRMRLPSPWKSPISTAHGMSGHL